MGLYDREYYQEDRPAMWLSGRPLVINLILINVAVWVAELVTDGRVADWLRLNPGLLEHPWQFYQLLTYGFVHDVETNAFAHIFFNMFGLWLFGSELENLYGKAELLRIYLTSIIFVGVVWVGIQTVQGGGAALLGASGGVMALMSLFVLNFPRRILLIWGILPTPAWVLGLVWVLLDVSGALHSTDNVAHGAHLAGALYGFIYFRTRWSLGRWAPRGLKWPSFRPRLKVHNPEAEARDLNEQVDQILAKISRSGEASLTNKERQTLERASRRYQQRRQ